MSFLGKECRTVLWRMKDFISTQRKALNLHLSIAYCPSFFKNVWKGFTQKVILGRQKHSAYWVLWVLCNPESMESAITCPDKLNAEVSVLSWTRFCSSSVIRTGLHLPTNNNMFYVHTCCVVSCLLQLQGFSHMWPCFSDKINVEFFYALGFSPALGFHWEIFSLTTLSFHTYNMWYHNQQLENNNILNF